MRRNPRLQIKESTKAAIRQSEWTAQLSDCFGKRSGQNKTQPWEPERHTNKVLFLVCNRKFTEYTHLAGTEGDDRLTQELYDTWIQQGLDHVATSTYELSNLLLPAKNNQFYNVLKLNSGGKYANKIVKRQTNKTKSVLLCSFFQVLLSYPDEDDDKVIFILDSNGATVFESQTAEKILHPSMNQSHVVPPFNAYSPPGDVQVNPHHTSNWNLISVFNWSCNGKTRRKPNVIYVMRQLGFSLKYMKLKIKPLPLWHSWFYGTCLSRCSSSGIGAEIQVEVWSAL